ncbi:MAG TPA: TolC family protein [Thermoanaerobaculia bacterium]|nr:TolC family protein [Thermoanaerobaculia bacterium]
MRSQLRNLFFAVPLAVAVSVSAQDAGTAPSKKTTSSTSSTSAAKAQKKSSDSEEERRSASPQYTEPREDESRSDALRLSLDEAIQTAVKQNLGVDIQRYDFRMAGYSARSRYGIFDPVGFADLSIASQQQPVTSSIFSSKTDRNLFNVGVSENTPTGGSLSVAFNNSRQKSASTFTTVNPAYSSDIGLAFNQPLLRNFGVDVTRRGINIARNNLGISQEAFRAVMMDTVLAVENAYYDLIFARENLEVKKQSRFLAGDQARITQIRIDVGASAPLDILQPRVAIATNEEQVIAAFAAVRDAEDRLRQLMNLPVPEWSRPILPNEQIGFTPMSVNVDDAVARAMELRPEVREVGLTKEIRRIQYMYARNQARPKVDFNLNYGVAGLGGNRIVRDPITGQPTGIDRGGYGDALSQISGFDFPSWTVGLNVGVPFSNIGARAERKRAELDLQSKEVDEARVRQNILVQVRKAARDIDTLAKQIGATRAAREAAEKNVDAERKRYENGMTTNFNVLLIQQQLSDARSLEISALAAYNQAIAGYHRAVGDLLDARNITVEEPEHFDLPHGRYENVGWMSFDKPSEVKNSDDH